jgi:AraC-like DNA-binding protein
MLVSTELVAERDKLEYWSQVVAEAFCGADFDWPTGGEGFYGSIEVQTRGPSRIGQIKAAAQSVLRTPARISQSTCEFFYLILQLRGSGVHTQVGRAGCLEPGDFLLIDTTRPYELSFTDAFTQLVLILPREGVTSRLPDVHKLTACTVKGHTGTGAIASVFIQQLLSHVSSVEAGSLPRLQASLLDLTTTALGEQRSAAVCGSASRNVLTQRVLQFIEDHLGDPELSCSSVAARHRISERYLRLLFSELTVSPSDWIWSRRLERARQDLTDPLKAARPVTTICFTWGFKDVAHFSRAFKARFGCTPSEARLVADSQQSSPQLNSAAVISPFRSRQEH